MPTAGVVSHPHCIAVFSICMNKSEFVIVDHSGVKGPNGSGLISTSSILDDGKSRTISVPS